MTLEKDKTSGNGDISRHENSEYEMSLFLQDYLSQFKDLRLVLLLDMVAPTTFSTSEASKHETYADFYFSKIIISQEAHKVFVNQRYAVK